MEVSGTSLQPCRSKPRRELIPKGRKGKEQHADSAWTVTRANGRSQTASLHVHSQVTVDEEQGYKHSLETALVKTRKAWLVNHHITTAGQEAEQADRV